MAWRHDEQRRRTFGVDKMKRTLVLLALLYAPFAGAAYKCTDEKGVTHIGDTPPAGCATVMITRSRGAAR
jgi:hypothetical protein